MICLGVQRLRTCAEVWRNFMRSACMSVTAWSSSFRGSSNSRTARQAQHCQSLFAVKSKALTPPQQLPDHAESW